MRDTRDIFVAPSIRRTRMDPRRASTVAVGERLPRSQRRASKCAKMKRKNEGGGGGGVGSGKTAKGEGDLIEWRRCFGYPFERC